MEIVSDLEAAMRDGTVLRADLYRPSGEGAGYGPWPVLLARTPYGRRDPGVLARIDPVKAATRGYLVVVQDCRGRFGSDGNWTPLAHEEADGYDTIAWASRLPDADGRVVMYGPSYLGHVQWAAAAARPPALRAIVPEFTWADPHDGLISRGGASELGLMTQWTLSLGANVLERRFADRPTQLHQQLAELNDAVDQLTTSTYWEHPRGATIRRLDLPLPLPGGQSLTGAVRAHVPALIVAGWHDCFLQGGLDAYATLRAHGTQASLIIGPWSHDVHTPRIGEVLLLDHELDWLDRQLRHRTPDSAAPAARGDGVLVYVTGAEEWRRIPAWPPAIADTTWFLHTHGVLSPEAPEPESTPDVFRNDPSNPVPTHGGGLLLTPDYPAGPLDQQLVEKREDVLVYTSAPLRSPLEVVGRIRLYLAGKSTAHTTDWVARLCDVDTDGTSRNVTDGILRTDQADAEHVIDLWSAFHVFPPGHRIRLHVTASCFPRWGRGTDARQTVHHDSTRRSRLILPVNDS